MRRFVQTEANQVCVTDADCVAASSGCADFDLAFCGQVPMNRIAAESDIWKEIVDEASCEDSCSTCLAALVPTCTRGLCASF